MKMKTHVGFYSIHLRGLCLTWVRTNIARARVTLVWISKRRKRRRFYFFACSLFLRVVATPDLCTRLSSSSPRSMLTDRSSVFDCPDRSDVDGVHCSRWRSCRCHYCHWECAEIWERYGSRSVSFRWRCDAWIMFVPCSNPGQSCGVAHETHILDASTVTIPRECARIKTWTLPMIGSVPFD